MYQSRTLVRPQADAGSYPTPPKNLILHPHPAVPMRRAQYLVSPSHPSWPASPPEYAIQAFDPALSNLDLATDVNTLMNRNNRPPGWTAVDDYYHERRFATPSSDAVWGRHRTQISVSRSTSITGTPESSRGSNYHSRYRYRIPHHAISEIEDDSEDHSEDYSEDYSEEDEAREPAEHHSRPWSDRQAPAIAAASGPSRRPLKGLKRVLHKLLSKLRRKRSSGRVPSSTTHLPTTPLQAAPTSAFTVSSTPWNAYDDVHYYTHDELTTGASILERTHTTIEVHVTHGQRHPLTVATGQAAERVQWAMQTGNSELGILMRGASRTRQVHDWEDGVVMD